jgi:hypothetical protein
MEVKRDPIRVMYVESTQGPVGAPDAFRALESRLSSLKGRKFYGTFQYPDGPYRACVALTEGDDPARLGLDVGEIPGGAYAQAKLSDWPDRIDEIHKVFAELSAAHAGRVDHTRPSVEFYRSQKELVLLLPLTER